MLYEIWRGSSATSQRRRRGPPGSHYESARLPLLACARDWLDFSCRRRSAMALGRLGVAGAGWNEFGCGGIYCRPWFPYLRRQGRDEGERRHRVRKMCRPSPARHA